MPRNITVTFGDGSTHVYQNAPDTLTPQDVAARAASDFGGRAVTNIDGGNPAPPAAAPAPSLMDSVVGTIKSAASSVADAASSVAGSVMPAISALAHSSETSDSPFAASTLPAPAAAPAPMSHGDMIDAASAGGIPVGPPTPNTKPVIPHTEAVAVDQAEARRKYWDDVPDGTFKSGYFQGTMPMAKAAGTAMQSVGDAVGSDALANYGAKFRSIAGQHLDRALEGNRDNLTASVIGNVVGLLPALTGSGGIAAMVGTSAANGYSDALDAGDTTAQAVARGTALGLANYVGMRVQVPGLTGALTKAVSGAPAGQAIAALGHALSTNVGGMEATTVLSDLYDKMAPGGLRPNMTAADLVSDIADTAKSAALLTVAMPGVPMAAGHLFHAAHSLAHGDGNAEASRAIDSANPPAAGAPTTSTDNTAAALPTPTLAGPVGLDTLHDSIDETARTVGLSPKATAALRDAAAQRDPQDAAAFVARAFHRMEANGLTTKAGAPGAFRDALAQRVADQQPEPPPAPKGKPSGKPSAADQLAAIRPLDQPPAPAPDATPADAAPAPAEPAPITPEAMAQANDIAGAAHQAATSPFNDTPEPTDAQKAAGNYKVGRVQLHGLDISIENPQGSTRSGVDPDGKPWQNEMAAHYGYIRGTHASDGDHVDTFIGPNPESKTAYVIDQVDPTTGKFDEPKTILGADSEQQARELYAKNYADGWNGLGAITPLPMDAFKAWVRDGVKSKPLGDISTWKATDERAQPDVAKLADVPSGAGDGGGGPAVASGGDLGQDAAVATGRGIGGDAAAPSGGARATAAVDAGGGADAALMPTEPAPRLLGKPVTDYETPALQKIANMKASSSRAREVASAEISRRAAQAAEKELAVQAAPAPQADETLTKQSLDKPRAGIDPDALRTEVTRIQAGWKDAPPVHVVDDVGGLPTHIQDSLRSMGAEGKTRALLMPGRGSDPGDVYLIASRLKDLPMAQAALFHEVLGHYGIRKVLGSDAVYSAEMYKLRQANPALASEAEAWMQRFGRGAIAARMERGLTMDQAMKVVRALSTEEALADRAGRGEPIRGLQSLMAKIQAWLRSIGLHSVADHLEKMTQAETASLLARARRAVEADADGGHRAGDLAPALSQRDDAPNELPDAVIGHPLATATTHPDYAAAKGGDPVAAHRLAEDLVTPQFVESVRKSIGKKDVIVQGVNSIEASGRNKIPLAVAQVLAHRLGAESANDIAQSTSPKRTSMDGLERLLRSPEFDGPVRTDKPYLLLDDTLTQGGTMAALASHIRQNGGRVAGEVALTGKDYSRKIALSPDLLSQVRERYASVEPDFRAATGYGFDALTESEARYLVKRSAPDAVRARIVEAGEQARRLADSGVDQETRASLSQRSSDAGGIGVAEGGRASSERIREGLLRPAEGAADGDAPLLSQHAADDAATPDAPKSHVADALAKVREATAEFASKAKAIRDDALLKTVPMSLGTPETRTIAKDFANADRLASWQWGKFDDVLTKNYDEAQRRDMFNASDEQSVLLQQGKKVGADEGLNSLSPDERKTVETLQGYGDSLLQRARDTGMFEGEGIPSWTPRMAVMVDGRGGFTRPKGAGAETGAKQGRNIVTTASSLKARKYLTSAETEAAMKGKLGDGAQLVRDIRVMPLAMARLEKAIAGRELINQIKAMGDRAGLETVSSSEKDGFFTVDHPAFKTWQATTSEDGTKSWEAKPLYVNKAFEGPLKAVMSETPGPVYSALMALKAKSMGLIMYSPLIHNAVEWGRALPAMPGKVATFRIYFEGNRIKNDPVQMRQAIKDGLVPIGKRGGIQDITGIMEDPSLTPGRSWTAKLIGGALGIANEKAGTVAKKGIDAAGDFWHNTLLWDRVGDLQAGLYGAMREKEIQKGVDPAVAGKLAAHFANRFAGALPNEAMSAGARKVANLLMFSRTFTLGNLGLMKDMITGLPRDIQAQIRTASGDLAAAAATSRARRIAIASFIVDIGLMYMGNSLMQDAIKKMKGDKTWGEIGRGYAERLHKLLERTGDHPLDTLSNPFDVMNSLSSTSENEPGKEDRIRVGTQDDGTAIYVRLPTGKVGEDFKNWITKPLITAKAKESQLVRPLQAIWNNDNGIGQRIYDPDAKGIGGVLTNAGRIAKLFATQMVPTDAIKGAMDWEGGNASTVDKLKVAGPLVGLTFSKGAPGGPEIGEMYDADRKFLGAKMDVMPDVKAAIKAGDDEKAVTLMEGIKMTPAEMNSTLRRLKVPESRLNAGAFRKFSQHASDEDMARMMQLLQGEHPAAAPAPAPEPAEEAAP